MRDHFTFILIPIRITQLLQSVAVRLAFVFIGAPTADQVSSMALKPFLEVKSDSHFSIHNLPYGIFKHAGGAVTTARPGVAIGDYVLDLSEIHSAGLFDGPLLSNSDCFLQVFALYFS